MEHKKGHTSQSHHTHTFKFFTSAKTALSNHAGLLMSVVTKPVKAWTGIKGKRIESVSWPGNTQFPQDDLSSAEIVFHREAARAQRDHVFCSHKKDSADHSVLIFQPSKKDSLRNVQAKAGQVDFHNVTFYLPIFQIISRYFNDSWRDSGKSSAWKGLWKVAEPSSPRKQTTASERIDRVSPSPCLYLYYIAIFR